MPTINVVIKEFGTNRKLENGFSAGFPIDYTAQNPSYYPDAQGVIREYCFCLWTFGDIFQTDPQNR